MWFQAVVAAILVVFWVILSGYFEPFLVAAGVGSAIAVTWFANRMELVDREGQTLQLWRPALVYWPWLGWEIVKSAWTVTRIILTPSLPISPTIVRFKPSQRSIVGLVTHANSITLTPGTITIEATANEFVVHGLTREGAQGCIDGEMDRRVAQFEAPA
ncbi:MAG: Na+/H+ antiporter subunit E [Burkholderiales bacterium]